LLSYDTGRTYPSAAVASCADMQATTYAVPPGYYTLGYELYGDPLIYGGLSPIIDSYYDPSGVFYLGSGITDYRGQSIVFFTQSFLFDWNLYSTSLGGYSGCNPGEQVDFEFAKPGSQTWVTRTFYCTDQSGFSFAIPLDYTSAQWNMYLVDSTGTRDLATIAGTVVPIPADADIDLGTQTFFVD
jgi:hypothetical protein